jgi:hypothetical protein
VNGGVNWGFGEASVLRVVRRVASRNSHQLQNPPSPRLLITSSLPPSPPPLLPFFPFLLLPSLLPSFQTPTNTSRHHHLIPSLLAWPATKSLRSDFRFRNKRTERYRGFLVNDDNEREGFDHQTAKEKDSKRRWRGYVEGRGEERG